MTPAPNPNSPKNPSVSLPGGTVNLVGELVPAIRSLLGRGLSEEFQRSCVRVGAFQAFGGGMKSGLVGGLRIDVNAVLKLGGPDLVLHQRLMDAVNAVRPRTFPVVLERVELDPKRQVLLMEDLRQYSTLLDLVYRYGLPDRALVPIVDKVIAALAAHRETGQRHRQSLPGIPVRPEPFLERLRNRLTAILSADPALAPLRTRPGRVMGIPCPPLAELLDGVEQGFRSARKPAEPALQHGDPHLGNVMVRRYGAGWSVRMIDPNPEVGFSDPLYDVGKLLHWAEPVGWAKVSPQSCLAVWRCGRGGWELDAQVRPPDARAELRRAKLEQLLLRQVPKLAPGASRDRLPVAIAAAHVGLGALLAGDAHQTTRRFVLAHTVRHLARFASNSSSPPDA